MKRLMIGLMYRLPFLAVGVVFSTAWVYFASRWMS